MEKEINTGFQDEQEKFGAGRRSLARISLSALFAALIAAGTFVAIPLPVTPVPIVLQNMFALLAGLTLGPAMGGAASALYLLAGAIGLPVFAGAVGGFVQFAGPTGGFLFGYPLSAILAGFIAGTPRSDKTTPLWRLAIAGFLGMAVLYVPGLLWLKMTLSASWVKTFAVGLTPFIVGDIIKTTIAVFSACGLRKGAAKALNG
ncbi:MAG: biotin transporter BioY [Spirochaetaceae bacterium]|jgi:biotin transport system substrate-specific component|nr:biotin transporter BioY [Spirochaetaceae bacterium]